MSSRSILAPLTDSVAQREKSFAAASACEEKVAGLFDRFRTPLFRYLSAFRLDPADIEEIIQEAFLALFQRLNRGDVVENSHGWLFGAAHNLALRQSNRLRKTWDAGQTRNANEVADRAPNPEDLYAHGELRERLHAVVDSLPELDRRCIVLRSEGLRYREIASILDMSLGAVALSLARSLERVARCAKRWDR